MDTWLRHQSSQALWVIGKPAGTYGKVRTGFGRILCDPAAKETGGEVLRLLK